jgi:hypothetical protein
VTAVTGEEDEEEPVRKRYFLWLYDQVFQVRDPDSDQSYIDVCDIMHAIPFNDSVPNDSNRTADGEELRDEFISLDAGIDLEAFTEMAGLGKASILEVLIGLSRRAGAIYEVYKPDEWARKFISNLGLMKYHDRRFLPRDILRVNRILRVFNSRSYDPDGKGGIFPLRSMVHQDQRQIELWFQMAAYVTENLMY